MLEAREYKYPDHVWNIKEIRAVNDAVDYVIDQAETQVDKMEKMLLVSTADEDGIARYEKILRLQPQDTATLEERRFAVMVKWYDTYPYTENDVKSRLDGLIPNGDYELTVGDGIITIDLGLSNLSMLGVVTDMLEEIVPLHIVLQINVRYNTHAQIAAAFSTHGAMANYKHIQLREMELEG